LARKRAPCSVLKKKSKAEISAVSSQEV